MAKHGLLIIGHGSRLEYGKELIEATKTMIENKTDDYLILSSFMEFNEPSVETGLAAMREADIDMLIAAPMFLAKGIHVLHDIPEILGLEEGKNHGEFVLANGTIVPMFYADPLGADPLLADLLLKNAQNAVLKTA